MGRCCESAGRAGGRVDARSSRANRSSPENRATMTQHTQLINSHWRPNRGSDRQGCELEAASLLSDNYTEASFTTASLVPPRSPPPSSRPVPPASRLPNTRSSLETVFDCQSSTLMNENLPEQVFVVSIRQLSFFDSKPMNYDDSAESAPTAYDDSAQSTPTA